jgi:NitT/TauT family transport system substrate-binding protein
LVEQEPRYPADVLKNYLPQAPAAITKALTGYSKADYPNAIQNESWKSPRITFQPFPYASYTTELIKQLRLTRVDDDNLWLNKINLKTAHSEFVASGLAERAINKLGGRRQFGLSSLTRKETIKP